jgi:hypothetical protein
MQEYSDLSTCSWVDHSREDLFQQWHVSQLWQASIWIKPTALEVSELRLRQAGAWLDHLPDLNHRDVVPELPRLWAADLSYPIVIHPMGWVMDGYHRIGKAFMQGQEKIWAVQFTDGSIPLPVIVIPNYLNRY